MSEGFKPQFARSDWFTRTAVSVNSFTKIKTSCGKCHSFFVGDRDDVMLWEQTHLKHCTPAREA
jgi:hypothetical protein